MKNFKKVMGVMMASAMTASVLAGCGSSKSAATADTQSAAAGTETGAASTDSAAAAGGTFKIGTIGPLTGDNAAYGLAVQYGAEIAVDEINKNGGINGYQVELKSEDDETDNQKSVNAYNTLKDWGMQFLDGSTTSACSIAVADYTKQDNMFQITPSGSAPDCVKNDNVFRVCFADPAQGTASAQYIAAHKLGTKIGIIYDSSDVYSNGIYQAFVQEAQKQGLTVVSQEAFTADSKTDFSVQLQKAKDGGADLLFLPIYYQQAALIFQQADKMGYKPLYFGCDGFDGILTVKNFDTSLAEGAMLLTPFAADALTPNQFAADSYDAIYAIKAAAEKANLTPDMSVSDICDKMKEAMTQITLKGLTSEKMTWEATGEPNKEPKAVVIKDGKYVSAQ